MSRIKNKFLELKSKNQKALIVYTMAGFPNEKATLDTVRGLIRGGADIIELGLPFSDPLADGPVIQNAAHVSLMKGINTERFFEIVKKIRKETQIPLVLMTYTNLLFSQGFDRFVSLAKKAGIDGFILPDMPIEEADSYLKAIHKNKLDAIFLASPNTSKERIQKIIKNSSGFLYLVSVFGTTGTQDKIKKYSMDAIKKSKKMSTGKIPLAVGFGISSPKQAQSFSKNGADAIIVGSALLRLVAKCNPKLIESQVEAFTKKLKRSI